MKRDMRGSSPGPLILTPLSGLPLVHPGDDLAVMIRKALSQAQISLKEGDILVLAQKIVSKAEGRVVELAGVAPSTRADKLAEETGKDPRVVELILRESRKVIRTRPGLIIVEHRRGFICANAGIDQSNVDPQGGVRGDWVLLLPEDPDASAARLRRRLRAAAGVDLGVLIIDSHGRPWRLGTVGFSIGLSGLPGLVDRRGEPDLYQQALRITEVGAADELAAGASLVMGQGAEGLPVVHVRGFPYPLREASQGELVRPEEEDLFR